MGISVLGQHNFSPIVQYSINISCKTLKSGNKCFYPTSPWKRRYDVYNLKGRNELIYVFKLEKDFSTDFQKKYLPKINSLKTEQIIDLGRKALELISNIGVDKLRSCEIKLNPSRKNSTAYNLNTGEYMGLHMDTHDGIKNVERENAWQLVSVNLGNAERYIHFVDLTFQQITDLLKIANNKEIKEDRFSMFKIVQLFFETYPSYPVNRIVLPPNYGYITQTQNIIHDGGTNWRGELDVSMLISGNFSF